MDVGRTRLEHGRTQKEDAAVFLRCPEKEITSHDRSLSSTYSSQHLAVDSDLRCHERRVPTPLRPHKLNRKPSQRVSKTLSFPELS